MDISFGEQRLEGLADINVVLGKNGVGKSRLLRAIDESLADQKASWIVKYVSPERGGDLNFQASVEQNQHRLVKLIAAAIKDKNITTIIATHSTAILGALSGDDAKCRSC